MKKRFNIFIALIILSFVLSIIMILYSGKRLEKVIVRYATAETERIANVILNDVVDLDDEIFDNDFYEIIKDNNGNINLIDFNSKEVNSILKVINDRAMKRLIALEKGNSEDLELSDSLKGTKLTYLKDGIVCDIPLGVLLNNSLLVNFSTSIPIRFSFIGTVSSNIFTDVKEYGFNNALIEVGVEVTIKEKITMPHSTETIPITTRVNLITQIVQGKVPEYYNNGFTTSSSSFSSESLL